MNFLNWFKTLVGLNPPVLGILGGIGKALFGDEPKTEIESRPTVLPEQRAVGRQLSSIFQGQQVLPSNLASSARGRFQEFTDPIVAGLSGLETLSLEGIEELTRGLVAGQGAEADVVGQAQGTFTDLLQQGPQDFEEFFQSAVFQPLFEQFQEEVLPEISARNAAAFFGSERLEQDERATEDLVEALAGSRGELAFQARESALDRAVDLLGLTGEVSGAGLGILERGLAAGEVPRNVETAELLSRYEEFLRGQGFDQNLIDQMLRFSVSPSQETVAATTGGSSGLLGTFLGGVGQTAFRGGGGGGGNLP